ncbi:MAG: hypothetical protein IJU44_02095 [Kiritimatiellae bacterium]|nr:hypothetical protein [Kiritimatiellia bacterium]
MRLKFWIAAIIAAFFSGSVFAEVIYTTANSSWGEALTVNENETIVIDGAEDGMWTGTITVKAGGVLKTRGGLTVNGATTVAAGGTIDIEDGSAYFNFNSKGVTGSVIIRSGALLTINRSDAFYYAGSFSLHVYGTFDGGNFRQSFNKQDRLYLYDGAQIFGAGDGNGALDFYVDGCRIIASGNSTVYAPVKARTTGGTLNVACCDNAHVYFAGGFVRGDNPNGNGNIVQVAATADEGNPTETCENSVLEIGPSTDGGKFVFISNAIVHLGGVICNYSIESTATEIQFVATKAAAAACHTLVQTMPAIATETATVRLTGDGTVALADTAPTFPIILDGVTLQVDPASPVALAAGSSVASASMIGAEGIAANTQATLLTGADATFDVTKLTVTAMRNGVILGSPAVVSLDSGNVVTSGVGEYDFDAWLTPFLNSVPLIWLDASDASTFVFKDNTFDKIEVWKDKSSWKRDATAYTGENATLGVAAGVPAVLMGDLGADIDLSFARTTEIRTGFWAMSIKPGYSFFLADDPDSGHNTSHFHRGSSGQYVNESWAMKGNSFYADGVKVGDPSGTIVPSDRHIYTIVTSANAAASRLSRDRTFANRGAGREFSELIVLPVVLSDADRGKIEDYLAAKWMGDSPTAATADGVYKFFSEMEVDGFIGGSKNLVFIDGSSIAIANPSSENPMVSTTGSVTLPSDSPLPITIDARALALGTYTVMEAGSGIISVDQFAATAVAASGAEGTFSVVNGKLLLTIDTAAASSSMTWRPNDADNLTWDTVSENWLLDDGVTMSPFLSYLNTVFDGNESVFGDINVAETLTPGPLSISGARDYTFVGAGALVGNAPILINGTGTITLNGPNLGDQEIIVSNATLRVGNGAGAYALGTKNGILKIAGGTLDINYNQSASDNAARNTITHRKVIELSNGGKIINDGMATTRAIGTLQVVDTGTIGGTKRLDIRSQGEDPDCPETTITGDDSAVLNFNNPEAAIYNATVNIGQINVLGGKTRIEANGTHNIKNGIHVADGAALGYWNSASSAGAAVYVDAGTAQIQAESGTSTMNGPLNVEAGATAQLAGGATLNYKGGVQNDGTLKVTSGTHKIKSVLNENADLQITGGAFYLCDGMSVRDATITASGGSSGLMVESDVPPTFDTFTINATAGAIDFLPRAAGTIVDVPGTVTVNHSADGSCYVYGPTNTTEYGMALNLIGGFGRIGIGQNAGRSATLELKSSSRVTVKNLYIGDWNSSPASGRLIIDNGAEVTVTSNLRNGHWSGAPAVASTHKVEISGTLDATGLITYNPYDSPRAEMILKEGGVLKTKGFNTRSNYGYGSGMGGGNGRQWFTMEGGRLELGDYGFNGYAYPGVAKYDFQNGTVINTSAAWGGVQGFPLFFGYDKLGGKVVFDMDEYYVNWNTALAGASDVTLRGSVNFQGSRIDDRLQGALLGMFTVENTGGNDLRNVSSFGGGLTLAENVNVQVAKYSDEHYLCAVSANITNTANSAWSYPYISADLFGYIYRRYTTQPRSNLATAGRGAFYVPEDQAGTWTFVGNYDNQVRLEIDGNHIFTTLRYDAMAKAQVELTAGWHTFTVAVMADGNPGGPRNEGFQQPSGVGRMAVGYLPMASDSTNGADYTPFAPGGDLQMRPYANACIWSWKNGTATDWDTTEAWTHMKAMRSVENMYASGNAPADDTQGLFSGKVNRFAGWFKVESGQEGEWSFKMTYDDYKSLKIDGEELINNTSWSAVPTATKELSTGWHRWEARVTDTGGGGWGAGSRNNGNTLSYIAPDDAAEKQFNETNLKLAATLGDVAVLEPTGIYKDLVLGEGSTLTSAGTVAMPIYGTLKGTGNLAGEFEFAGADSRWDLSGVANQQALIGATFQNASADTFTGLKSLNVEFDTKPQRSYYTIAQGVSGLADADFSNVNIVATAGEDDYSQNFALAAQGNRLVLKNNKPGGSVIILR